MKTIKHTNHDGSVVQVSAGNNVSIEDSAIASFNVSNKETIGHIGRTKGRSTMLSELQLRLSDCNDGFKKRNGFRFTLSGHKNGGTVSHFKSLADVDDHLRKLYVVRRWID